MGDGYSSMYACVCVWGCAHETWQKWYVAERVKPYRHQPHTHTHKHTRTHSEQGGNHVYNYGVSTRTHSNMLMSNGVGRAQQLVLQGIDGRCHDAYGNDSNSASLIFARPVYRTCYSSSMCVLCSVLVSRIIALARTQNDVIHSTAYILDSVLQLKICDPGRSGFSGCMPARTAL